MNYCMVSFIFLLENVLSIHSINLLAWEACNYGDIVENLCSKCVCTLNGVYDCEPRDCEAVQEIYVRKPEACQPNKVYNQGSSSCICTAEGQWPHKTCHDTFRYLPEDSTTKNTCESNGYMRVDCNVCRCTDKGEVDPTRCTLNECNTKSKYRKNNEEPKNNLFGQCLVKSWYSLAPCQFCYCIDTNKLMCSTSIANTNRQGQNMNLGPSTLILCGPGLLREIAELVPNSAKLRAHADQATISTDLWIGENKEVSTDPKANEESTNKALEIDLGPVTAQLDMARSDEEEFSAEAEAGNKLYPEETTVDNHRYRRNGGPIHNYDPIAVARKFLNDRRTVTISTGTSCKPGSTVNVKCNVCHCLKNGKMLCTDNKC